MLCYYKLNYAICLTPTLYPRTLNVNRTSSREELILLPVQQQKPRSACVSVWSTHLLFCHMNVQKLNLFYTKFQYSSCLPSDRILNRRLNNEINWIDVRFSIGSRKKVNRLCTFFHFGLHYFLRQLLKNRRCHAIALGYIN